MTARVKIICKNCGGDIGDRTALRTIKCRNCGHERPLRNRKPNAATTSRNEMMTDLLKTLTRESE